MMIRNAILSSVLCVLASVPAVAQYPYAPAAVYDAYPAPYRGSVFYPSPRFFPPQPVAPYELNGFIGQTMRGHAFAPLGIVSAANRQSGTVAIVGRHGELATVHTSMLVRRGKSQLRAPLLTRGDIAAASFGGRSRVPFVRGEVYVEEPGVAPLPPAYVYPADAFPVFEDCVTNLGLLYRWPSHLCR